MGTNYSARFNHCPHCGRSEQVPIGKFSAGWEFRFHGPTIDGKQIRSWAEWKAFLLDKKPTLECDGGEALSLADFIRSVEDSRTTTLHAGKSPRNHIDACVASDSPYTRKSQQYRLEHGHDWHDPEHWSFSSSEFS